MIDSETFNRLKAVPEREWGEIYKKLTLYAHLKLTRIGFVPRSEKDNVTAEDFAQQAITKIFEGTRTWDYERFPDIFIHLKGVVKSLISSHLKSSKRAARVVGKNIPVEVVETSEDLGAAKEVAADDDPEELLITDEYYHVMEKEFGEDMDGFLIFCDWLDDKPPRDLAGIYNMDVKQVYNIIKKGKRILNKVLLN